MKVIQGLTLFYDGACPLCQAEILFLSRRNQLGLLHFIDVNSRQYQPEVTGISCADALDAMSGQFDDGVVIQGVEVFSEAYRRANLPVLAWVFSRKLAQPFLKMSYRFFVRHRHRISKIFGPAALWLVRK